jgi:hypothetical protein
MRALQRLHRKLGALGVELVAVERERLGLAEGRAQVIDKFHCRRLAETIVESEWSEIVRVDPRNEAYLHASAEHLIDDCDLLGKSQRMIERNDIAHRANAHSTRACAGAHRIQARRRHPAFIGAEVVLDAEAVVEAELVA